MDGETDETMTENPVVEEQKPDPAVLILAGISAAVLAAAAYTFGKKEHEE
jgi:hypothetical protein